MHFYLILKVGVKVVMDPPPRQPTIQMSLGMPNQDHHERSKKTYSYVCNHKMNQHKEFNYKMNNIKIKEFNHKM